MRFLAWSPPCPSPVPVVNYNYILLVSPFQLASPTHASFESTYLSLNKPLFYYLQLHITANMHRTYSMRQARAPTGKIST